MKHALLLIFILASTVFGASESSNDVFERLQGSNLRSQSSILTIPVSVINRDGEVIEGLKGEDFRVVTDKKPSQIVSVEERKSPASVGFLIDVSRSMNAKYINEARKAIITIIENSDPRNEFFVKAFHSTVDVLSPFSDGKSISKIIDSDPYFSSDRSGRPTLYDAVGAGLMEFSKAKHDRHILIVFGDARDKSSAMTSNELRTMVGKGFVIIHFFGRSSGELPATYSEFSKIARESGGFSSNPFDDLKERPILGGVAPWSRISYRGKNMIFSEFWTLFFTDFSNQLASTYLISFKPAQSSKSDDKRNVTVTAELTPELKVKHKEAIVRSKTGF